MQKYITLGPKKHEFSMNIDYCSKPRNNSPKIFSQDLTNIGNILNLCFIISGGGFVTSKNQIVLNKRTHFRQTKRKRFFIECISLFKTYVLSSKIYSNDLTNIGTILGKYYI